MDCHDAETETRPDFELRSRALSALETLLIQENRMHQHEFGRAGWRRLTNLESRTPSMISSPSRLGFD